MSSLLVIIPDYFQATEPQTRLQVIGTWEMLNVLSQDACFI